ncbi:MAG TPA: hypothetical protein VLH15_02970 [Dehalococcoidales bacterium]|nr:hypothetical protein [Dehalococcoidales bacterium]
MRKKSTLWKLPLLAILIAILIFPAAAVSAAGPTPVTLILPSGVSGPNGEVTQTAGFTAVDPSAFTVTLVSDTGTQVAGPFAGMFDSYPELPAISTWESAQIISSQPSAWTTLSGANWISSTSGNSGVEVASEGEAWRIFKTTFNVPTGPTLTSAAIQIAGDNAYEFYLNDSLVDSTASFDPAAPVYGIASAGGTTAPFTSAKTYNLKPVEGENTLIIVLRNWNNDGNPNPTGLIFKINLSYAVNNQLDPAAYSASGNWYTAPAVDRHPHWVELAGAKWVSTTSANYGVENPDEGDTWRLFRQEFYIPACADSPSGSIQIASDNAFEFYLNGYLVSTSADFSPSAPVYGPWPGDGSQAPFQNVYSYNFTPQKGTNTLTFVVRNWNNNSSNPSGLLYKAEIQYSQPLRPSGVWWLNSIDHNTVSDRLQMEKILDIQTGSVNLAPEDPLFWLSDEAAKIDVTFPAGDWTLSLHTTADWGSNWEAEVGIWDTAAGEFTPFTSLKSFSWDPASSRLNIILTGPAATVIKGNYVALKLTSFSGGTVITDYQLCGSYLAPPANSPPYPVPELSALILLALGLATLSAILLIRRKKDQAKVLS